jgi:hypothetical protein
MFEYDPSKSLANKTKHGIDFVRAQELWLDPNRLVIKARTTDEERFLLIANLKDSLWTAIYTIRNKKIRIISVRKARDNEKEFYTSI